MGGMYMAGYYLGQFTAGALMGGLIPFIIFAVKKQWSLGFFGLAVCGMLAFAHPVASVVAGAAFLVGAIRAYNNRG